MSAFPQYVDLEYEGGGIGEYQYWDRTTQQVFNCSTNSALSFFFCLIITFGSSSQWNDTSCEYAEGGRRDRKDRKLEEESRCAKMDWCVYGIRVLFCFIPGLTKKAKSVPNFLLTCLYAMCRSCVQPPGGHPLFRAWVLQASQLRRLDGAAL